MNIFERRESAVRSYSRNWPVVFDRGAGSWLYSVEGTPYLDFFAGAGSLNYGHNNPALRQALINYLAHNGVTHALDMWTLARADLLRAIEEQILYPRGLDYKVVFPGPSGASAVEAAIKLARKASGRQWVAHFDQAFHGMSLGALSVNGNPSVRQTAGIPLSFRAELPYGCNSNAASEADIEKQLADTVGGLDNTAAVIVETVQGEGGIRVARAEWLEQLAEVCRRNHILVIIDDIQMGCGRVGSFFSFEHTNVQPDMVCLSKSISGYGLPLALLMIRPELDVWQPAEHNGTFRGLNLAFITGAEALRTYWSDRNLEETTYRKAEILSKGLRKIVRDYPNLAIAWRGRGLAQGLVAPNGQAAGAIRDAAFEHRLLVETCGSEGQVVKLMPPLTVSEEEILEALQILETSVRVASL